MSNYIQDLGQYEQGLGLDIGGALKKFGSAGISIIQERGAAAGRAEAAMEIAQAQAAAAAGRRGAGMPSWLLPVGIGGAGLVLILVLKKKK